MEAQLPPLARLRRRLEAYRRGHAEAMIWGFRGDRDAESPDEVSRGFAAEVHSFAEGLDACAALGLFEAGEEAAMAAHLARAVSDGVLGDARRRLEGFRSVPVLVDGRSHAAAVWIRDLRAEPNAKRRRAIASSLAHAAEPIERRLRDAREESHRRSEPHLRGAPLDGPPPGPELLTQARAFLDDTDALAAEARRWLGRDVGTRPLEWHDLVWLSSAGEDNGWPREGRIRRVGSDLNHLGFGEELRNRVRVEPSSPGADLRFRVVAPEVPGKVHLAMSPSEAGLLSELAVLEAIGRALALILTNPGLPPALRWPVAGGVGRALGVLFAQLLTDRGFLRRLRGLDRATAERVGRSAAAFLTLEARLHTAAYVARAEEPDLGRRRAHAAECLSRGMGVAVPPVLASLVAVTPAALGPRLAARLEGLTAAWAFRERYDEDWFRNPRSSEPVRAAAGRGGSVPGRGLIEAIGGPPAKTGPGALAKHAAERLVEGFA